MKMPFTLPRQVWFAIFGVVLLLAFGWVAMKSGPLASIKVTVTQVSKGEVAPALFGIGTVEARRAYLIGPTVAGRVERVLVDVGDTVKADQLLAEMDPVDLDQRVASTVAAAERGRSAVATAETLNRPGVPGLLDAINASQTSNHNVNAVLVRVAEDRSPEAVAQDIRRWKHLQVFTRDQMEDILVAKLIATSAKQIGMFLVILTIVSAAIVAFIIYTMTLGKIREIAVLKLIGTPNRTIAGMILQQALGLGLIGFAVGKIAATVWRPAFPRYVLLEPGDAVRGFVIVMVVCTIASTLAIYAALKVDPATAIGG